jgi:hypothetical protein
LDEYYRQPFGKDGNAKRIEPGRAAVYFSGFYRINYSEPYADFGF